MRAIAIGMLAVLGCSSEPPIVSSDVSTRDMSLTVYADGDAAGTHVRVTLQGPRGPVTLVDSDRLVLHAGDVGFPLARNETGFLVTDLAPGTAGLGLRIAREAPETSVDVAIPMPPLTAIDLPPSASRAAPLAVKWTPAEGPQTLTLALAGSCIPAISRPLSIDVGSYTLQPADLAGPSAETCAVTVTLTRALVEESDAPPLQHRYLSLTQVATAVLESAP
jgi:hypothetical protein